MSDAPVSEIVPRDEVYHLTLDSYFPKRVPSSDPLRVLVPACGAFSEADVLANFLYERVQKPVAITAFDNDPKLVADAQRTLQRDIENCTFVVQVGDINNYANLLDGSIDAIVCRHPNLTDKINWKDFFKDARSHLAPDAVVFATCYERWEADMLNGQLTGDLYTTFPIMKSNHAHFFPDQKSRSDGYIVIARFSKTTTAR
jgi:hypothetical protein